jgi:hypothetical protein
MCQYVDDLAASGNPLRDDELVAYLLAGLDEEFNPVLTAVVARVDPITPSGLYSQLLSFEHHTSLQSHSSPGGSSSAMAASHGRGLSGGRGFGAPSHGQSWFFWQLQQQLIIPAPVLALWEDWSYDQEMLVQI